jgi:AcrR family transcriptional regulator
MPVKPLTPELIVQTSIALADRDGLEAVSIRRIAALLEARPMSLYDHFDSKKSLVAAMLRTSLEEAVVTPPAADWRQALWEIAVRTLEVGARHPWLLEASLAPSGAPDRVPRHATQSLEALSTVAVSDGVRRQLLEAVDTYTIGFAARALAGRTTPTNADSTVLEEFKPGFDWLLAGFEAQTLGST